MAEHAVPESLLPPGAKALVFDCDGTLIDSMAYHYGVREHRSIRAASKRANSCARQRPSAVRPQNRRERESWARRPPARRARPVETRRRRAPPSALSLLSSRLSVCLSVCAQAWRHASDHFGLTFTPAMIVELAGTQVNELFEIICQRSGKVRLRVKQPQ